MESIDSALSRIGLGRFHFILFLILGSHIVCFSFQMIIITLLGMILRFHWKVSDIEVYLITTGSFVGLMVGSLLIGKSCDRYGRKKTLLLSNLGMIYFGIMSSLSPTVYWIIIMQFMTSTFCSGIILTVFTLMSELTPMKFRGIFLITLELFWAIGSMVLTVLCFLIVPVLGWRAFLAISNIPLVCASIALIWVPESPRILLLHNEKVKCLEVINRIAEMNKSSFITDLHEIQDPRSSFQDLIHPNYLLTTILTSFMFFVSCVTLYSVILIVPIINTLPHKCLQRLSTTSTSQSYYKNNTIDDSCGFEISLVTFKDMFISISAEFIITIISLILINFIGRKKIIAIYLFILTLGCFLLNFCMSPIQLSILLFFTRGAATAYFDLITLFATEVFPTSVRGFGLGICSMSARAGGIVSPFIVNIVIVKFTFIGGTTILCILNFAALIASFLLPYETKDRKLYQTASHTSSEVGSVHRNNPIKYKSFSKE